MSEKPTSYLKTQETSQEYTFLILAEHSPILIDALTESIKKQDGTVYTHAKKNMSADYLIVFDNPRKLTQSLKYLASGGKALHVVTDDTFDEAGQKNIAVFTIPRGKIYTIHTLVTKILASLFASPAYIHAPKKTPIKKRLPTLKTSDVIKKIPRFHSRWLLPSGIIAAILIAPFMLWVLAIVVSLNSLYGLQNPDLTNQTRIQKSNTAVFATHVVTSMTRPLLPLVKTVSPKMATIISRHLAIVTSVASTAQLASEQAELLEPDIVSLVSGGTGNIDDKIESIQKSITALNDQLLPSVSAIDQLEMYKENALVKPVWPKYEKIREASKLLGKGNTFIETLPDILAIGTRKKYLLLLQNNFEIRPTGGFIGSFALITVENGRIIEVAVQDVYEADGQLKGHVDPPIPLALHLNQPNWFLRDSNWNPDFALSAKQAEWFLAKETGEQVHGVIAIDLFFLKNILDATGGIYVPDYQATVTGDDFFLKLQSDTHDSFFPGSSKKRNVIDALTNALLIDITKQDPATFLKVIAATERSLEEKHMLISSHDQNVQETVEYLGWGGRIASHQAVLGSTSDILADYVMVVDANLGVNKVNAHINRELLTTVELTDTTIERELVIYYKNTSEKTGDSLMNGTYKNYVRIMLPSSANVQFVGFDTNNQNLLGQATTETFDDKQSIGLLVEVSPRQDKRVVVRYSYKRPPTKEFSYQLMVQKQPGTDSDPLVFKLETTATNHLTRTNIAAFPYLIHLTSDRLLTVDFKRTVK